MNADHREADIIVAGAGASGLVAAIALAKAGFSVICAGRNEARPNGRTVALFEGSLRVLNALDVWRSFEAASQRIAAIRLVDDTGSRWPIPQLTLRAREIGLEALGANIENDRLVTGLHAQAEAVDDLFLTGDVLTDIAIGSERVEARDGSGRTYAARLLVAADGRRSPSRAAAGIGSSTWAYPQVAITALLGHEKPHAGLSTEFHTRGGPCTLVPLAGTAEHPHRSSLVWLMTPEEGERRQKLDDATLAAELETRTRRIVGRITFEAARGYFPIGGLKVNRLVGPRTALVGEAAHAFPPLAAQGLNLSIRDVAHLVVELAAMRGRSADPGGAAALRAYEGARRKDVRIRTDGVDVLNRAIMTDLAPVDAVRGAGAALIRVVGPLRRAALREGILAPCPDVRPALRRIGGDAGAQKREPLSAA